MSLHKTLDTFLAGTIFALATTFILVVSTKLLDVVVVYANAFLGVLFRILVVFTYDRVRGLPVTLDVGFVRFKKIIVGPKPMGDGSGDGMKEKQLSDMDIDEIVPVIGFGLVNYAGEGSWVSYVVSAVGVGFGVVVIVVVFVCYFYCLFLFFLPALWWERSNEMGGNDENKWQKFIK